MVSGRIRQDTANVKPGVVFAVRSIQLGGLYSPLHESDGESNFLLFILDQITQEKRITQP
jgi:hypothetical protein